MEPTPYAHLAAHYDSLFRLNPRLVTFLRASLGGLEGRRILDAGCGTGTLALALADEGALPAGVDLDPHLLEVARRKAGERAFPLFREGDLSRTPPPGHLLPLDAVLCLGNTLPHLPDLATVRAFLALAFHHLRPGGLLLIQTVPFDRLLDEEATGLAPIERTDCRLERSYAPLADGRLAFTTRLTSDLGESTSTQPLLPLRAATLRGMAEAAGFHAVASLGDVDGQPYTTSSPAHLLQARRP